MYMRISGPDAMTRITLRRDEVRHAVSEEAEYFTVFSGENGRLFCRRTGAELIRNNGTLHVYVTGDTAAFSNDLHNNFIQMTSAARLVSVVSGKCMHFRPIVGL